MAKNNKISHDDAVTAINYFEDFVESLPARFAAFGVAVTEKRIVEAADSLTFLRFGFHIRDIFAPSV